MEPIYNIVWDYIQNSPCVAHSLEIGISVIAGAGLYNLIDKCANIRHLRKGKQSKLEKDAKGE
jgi:hypothetical protein